jgi:hypothetical protein
MRHLFRAVVFAAVTFAPACREVPRTTEESIARGDWPTVATARELTPGHRIPAVLKAHASLALNRTNEALCMLASLSADDRRTWDEWTGRFVKAHGDSAVAHYLRGDALARQNRWDDAAGAFDASLAIDPEQVLALNARGIVRSFKGDWQRAMADFVRASDLDGRFVDALASRGFSQLQSKAGPEGALDAFESALQRMPDFATAAAGKAYAQLALARWDEGNRTLAAAAAMMSCARFLIDDGVSKLTAWVEAQSGATDGDESLPPGTQLDRHLGSLARGNVGALSPIARIVGANPALGVRVGATLEGIKQQNPALYNRVTNRISSGQDWTRPNGGAVTLLSGLRGVGVAGGATVGRPPLTVNGTVSFNPARAVDLQLQKMQKTTIDHKGWSALGSIVGARPAPAGVTTSLSAANVDRGDWPFKPIYTLLYGDERGLP